MSSTGNTISWARRRASLNHDVLCNMVLVELAAARPGSDLTRLAQWLNAVSDYSAFLQAAPDVLDASLLLDRPLFACWSAENREAVRPLFRELYLRDHSVREKTERLLSLLAECEAAAKAALAPDANTASIHRAECLLRELSQGISQLPDPVADFGLERN